MKKIIYVLGVMIAAGAMAQDKKAMKYAKTIKAEDLKTHLSVIASDEYEGRETGKKGQKMAAEYIANHFKSLGFEAPVDGSYLQKFDLTESTISVSYFRKGDERKMVFEDFIYYSSSETAGEEYINVVVADDEDSMMDSYKGAYVAYQVEKLGGLQDRINAAKEGDKLVLANPDLTAWMFGKKYDEIEAGDKAQLIFNADYLDKPVGTENVLGFLKGTEKPDEVVVITSHYDHIGISSDGQINNGANDDGSGTVTVLELAEAFSKAAAKKAGPKRSILFMTVTGEEKGLLGSRYYTDMDPIFPLENTVANLNVDMVGRIDEKHAENPEYIYVIGSDKLSKDLHDLSEEANKTYTNLELDYTYNDENDPNRFYYRSDHYNFAKNNIPIIFYFNGTHPDYHKPTDTIEKIDFEIMEKIARLVFHTGWEVANREERIKLD